MSIGVTVTCASELRTSTYFTRPRASRLCKTASRPLLNFSVDAGSHLVVRSTTIIVTVWPRWVWQYSSGSGGFLAQPKNAPAMKHTEMKASVLRNVRTGQHARDAYGVILPQAAACKIAVIARVPSQPISDPKSTYVIVYTQASRNLGAITFGSR